MRRARPSDDRGLADARLTDEHRIVLGAARQHLDHAANLFVAADHRIELALARVLGEVAPEAFERLVLLLGVLTGHSVAPTHLLQRRQHGVACDAQAPEEVAHAARDVGHREQEMLGREIVVTEVGALSVCRFERRVCVLRELRLLRGLSVHLRESAQQLVHPVAHDLARHADALEHGEDHALGLRDECGEQVLGRDLGVVVLPRQRLGGTQRLAGLVGQLVGVERHVFTSGRRSQYPKLTIPLSSLFPRYPVNRGAMMISSSCAS